MKELMNKFNKYNKMLNKSDSSIIEYRKIVEKFILDYEIKKEEDLKVLSNKDFVNDYVETLIGKYAPATINKNKAGVSVFSSFLVKEEIISENKIKNIPNIMNNDVKIETYTDDEIQNIKNLIDKKIKEDNFKRKIDKKTFQMNRTIIRFMISTGIRVNEVSSIRLNDVNGNVVAIRGKGHKGKISRYVTISEEVKPYFNEYLEIRSSLNIKEDSKDMLWISPLTKKHISNDGIRKFLKNILKELGIEEKCLHSLRHYKASDLVSKDVSIAKVAKFLGNSEKVCFRYYVHQELEDIDELVNM